MKHTLAAPVLMLWLAIATPSVAQAGPGSPAPWQYAPLQEGNEWVYRHSVQHVGDYCENPTWSAGRYYELAVNGVLDVEGEDWFVVTQSVRDSGTYQVVGPPIDHHVRYDSTETRVVRRESVGYWFFPSCNLQASPGESGRCTPDVEVDLGWVGDIGGERVEGAYKGFEYRGETSWHRYVSDVGLVSSGRYDCGGSRYDLVYARVGGRQVGEMPQAVAAEDPVAASVLEVSVHPNPVSAVATVTLEGPAREWVRVAVYDVLGKEVTVVADGVVGSVSKTFRVDLRALAPGVYVVRAHSQTADATVPISIVR